MCFLGVHSCGRDLEFVVETCARSAAPFLDHCAETVARMTLRSGARFLGVIRAKPIL